MGEDEGRLNFSVVIALDKYHLNELQLTLPTWRKYKPELWDVPWIVLIDKLYLSRLDASRFLDALRVGWTIVDWPPKLKRYATQREKMLASLYYAGRYVKTPWWLRIDTDVVAYKPGRWIPEPKRSTVMIGHQEVSNISNELKRLDSWANTIPEFSMVKRRTRFRKTPKLCGWFRFHRTDWSRQVANIAEKHCGWLSTPFEGREDAFFMWCALKFRKRYEWFNIRTTGWWHPRRGRTLESMVSDAMQQ